MIFCSTGSPSGCGSPSPSISSSSSSLSPMNSPEENLRPFFAEKDLAANYGIKLRRMSSLVIKQAFWFNSKTTKSNMFR